MDIFLNFGLAWISVLLAIILTIVYLTRKAIIKFPKSRNFFIKLNKALRKYHKFIGAALVVTGLIHGLFSSEKLLSINWGTANWILSILLGISWMLKKKLTGKRNWMYFHRILVVIFSLSLIIHVIDAGGIQIFKVLKNPPPSIAEYQIDEPFTTPAVTYSSDNTVSAAPSSMTGQTQPPTIVPTPDLTKCNVYKDGTFTGEAIGFQPGLIMSVIIKDNQIVSVEVTEHNEINSRYWSTPVSIIPKRIVDTQTTEVDTISGASYTSTGIINAVNDALRQALVSGTVPDDLPPGSCR